MSSGTLLIFVTSTKRLTSNASILLCVCARSKHWEARRAAIMIKESIFKSLNYCHRLQRDLLHRSISISKYDLFVLQTNNDEQWMPIVFLFLLWFSVCNGAYIFNRLYNIHWIKGRKPFFSVWTYMHHWYGTINTQMNKKIPSGWFDKMSIWIEIGRKKTTSLLNILHICSAIFICLPQGMKSTPKCT